MVAKNASTRARSADVIALPARHSLARCLSADTFAVPTLPRSDSRKSARARYHGLGVNVSRQRAFENV
jgi:hypothetical protein